MAITYIHDTPIRIKHTTARLAHDIIEHNIAHKFSVVLGIAVPGAGKTTGLTGLIHSIHTKDDNYDIHWYNKEQFKRMDEVLEALPKRQDCVLVFDDISYVLDELTEDELSKILYKLSVVREVLDPNRKETRCIVVLIFHYSFAVPKALRSQASFRIQFSITDEERENYKKTMGYENRKPIAKFMRKYISMIRYRTFSIPAPRGFKDPEGKPLKMIKYTRDKPFRIALVSNMGELHYWLYHKSSCEKCSRARQKGKLDAVLIADLVAQEGFSRVYKNAKYVSYQNGNKRAIPAADGRIMKHLDDLFKTHGVDPHELVMLLREVRSQPRGERSAFFISKLKELEKLSLEDQKKVEELASKIEPETGDENDIDIAEEETEENSGIDDPAAIFKGNWWKP